MEYIIAIGNNNFQVWGDEAAWEAFNTGSDFAKTIGCECYLIDASTGEILGGTDLPEDDEPYDIDSDCGYDPYLGECTDDC